jgi:hypothetical protein
MGPTMIDVAHHPQGKARVWLGEQPSCSYRAERTLALEIPTQTLRNVPQRQAAVEIYYHAGGYFPYGLLGAEYHASRSGQLLVEVLCSDRLDAPWPVSVAGTRDDVHVGLLREYGDGVLDAVFDLEQNTKLGPGLLRFNCAAHGAVGSLKSIFVRLAKTLVSLLNLSESGADEETLAEIIRSFR